MLFFIVLFIVIALPTIAIVLFVAIRSKSNKSLLVVFYCLCYSLKRVSNTEKKAWTNVQNDNKNEVKIQRAIINNSPENLRALTLLGAIEKIRYYYRHIGKINNLIMIGQKGMTFVHDFC